MSLSVAATTNTPRVREMYGLDPLLGFALLVGSIFVVESPIRMSLLGAISILLLPVTISQVRGRVPRLLKKLVIFWVLSICILGMIHSAARYSTWFMAVYPVAILGVALLICYICGSDEKKYFGCAMYISAGIVAGYFVQPIGVMGVDPLKAGPGIALCIAVYSLLSWRSSSPSIVFIISIFLGSFLLLQDFRNAAAAALVTGVISLIFGKRESAPNFRSAISVILVAAIVSLISVSAVTQLAKSGYLGSNLAAVTQKQSNADGGLIVGGRPETVASLVAIEGAPIIGRGGSPRLSYSERLEAIERMDNAGIAPSPVEINRILGRQINSHSIFFSAWVAYGVIGALAWIAILAGIWVAALLAILKSARLYPLLVFGAMQLSWDIFFSPWNARGEIIFGLFCAIAVSQISRAVSPLALNAGESKDSGVMPQKFNRDAGNSV